MEVCGVKCSKGQRKRTKMVERGGEGSSEEEGGIPDVVATKDTRS